MQHQQPPQPPTFNAAASFSPNPITTEQIQKCLDDNKNLIMAIMENQNLGKFQECAQYQAMLQKNLMYLAAIADAQPPAPQPANPSQVMQMPPNSMPQQANNYMQQPQSATPQQPQQGGVQQLPFQLNNLQKQQQLMQIQQMGLRPGAQNGMLGMHQAMQSPLVGNPGNLMDGRGRKQDGSAAASGGDSKGKSRGTGGNRDL